MKYTFIILGVVFFQLLGLAENGNKNEFQFLIRNFNAENFDEILSPGSFLNDDHIKLKQFLLAQVFYKKSNYKASNELLKQLKSSEKGVILNLIEFQIFRNFVLLGDLKSLNNQIDLIIKKGTHLWLERYFKNEILNLKNHSEDIVVPDYFYSKAVSISNYYVSDLEFLLLYLKNLDESNFKDRWFVLKHFWLKGNIKNTEKKLTKNDLKLIKKHTSTESFSDWVRHLRYQNQYKNYAYVKKNILVLLKKSNTSDQKSKLSSVYVETLIKEKLYSKTLEEIDKKDFLKKYLPVSERENINFDLLLKKGQIQKAANFNQKFFKNKKKSWNYYRLAKYYYNRKKYKKAEIWFNKVDQMYFLSGQLEKFKWEKFFTLYQLKKTKNLKKVVEWSDKHKFESLSIKAKFCYWKNKFSKVKDIRCFPSTINNYYTIKSINYNNKFDNYFHKKSAEKKGRLKGIEKDQLEWIELLYRIAHYDIADALMMQLFHYNKGIRLFKYVVPLLENHKRYYLVQKMLGDYYFGQWHVLEKDKLFFYKTAYPLAYFNQISKIAIKRGVSPYLILAIIREESHFSPKIKSHAGAIGLMQLMPNTAKHIGKIDKISFKKNDLLLPEMNIRLGVGYLTWLVGKFKGNFVLVLAAYNGGYTNVRRWLKGRKNVDDDNFIENIPFPETRKYVKKVLRSYELYKLIYGKNKKA